jgi:hypothetical protein
MRRKMTIVTHHENVLRDDAQENDDRQTSRKRVARSCAGKCCHLRIPRSLQSRAIVVPLWQPVVSRFSDLPPQVRIPEPRDSRFFLKTVAPFFS